jgi:hypothetical protein
MAFSIGIAKQVAYKKETTWGTAAGAADAKLLRRVTSSFNLEKEAYESAEIRTDYQIADFRHGVRSAAGTLNGELSPGTYSEFIGSAVAKDFVAGATLAAVTYSVTVEGVGYRITKTAPATSFVGLFFVGDVVRITAAGGNVANTGRNLLVTAVTATTLDVIPVDRGTMVTESAIASATIACPGKKTFAPITGHTDDSYTIEEFFSDISQSEVYLGMKVGSLSLALPATGLVTCDFGFMGKDITTGTTQYFTSPAALSTSGIFASVNGVLLINSVPVALLTGLNINLNRNMQSATVVGSNSIAELFEGRISVDGDFSAYFEDGDIRELFLNENEVSLVVTLSTSSAKDADFMSFTLPRIKINSNTKDDGEQGIVAQHSFRALLPASTVTTVNQSTIVVQDSLA